MDYKGTYVELFGKPSDNNAQVRSDGYTAVISQYPDLKQVGKEIANWDRQQGQDKMESLLSQEPRHHGRHRRQRRDGPRRDQRAQGRRASSTRSRCSASTATRTPSNAVKNGEMVATVLQPIVEGTKKAIAQLDSVHPHRQDRGRRGEAGHRLRADHQGQRRQAQQLRVQRLESRRRAVCE